LAKNIEVVVTVPEFTLPTPDYGDFVTKSELIRGMAILKGSRAR